MSAVGQAAVLVAFPVAASAIGSVIAVLRRPGPRLVGAIQHFAAGVVVAALAGEVLPGLREEGNLGWAATGFVAGVAVVLALAAYGRRRDAAASGPAGSTAGAGGGGAATVVLPLGLLVAVGIDLLIDGMLVGLGVTLGSTQGLILTIALTIEILFLGLSLAAELTDTGLSKTRAALVCTGLGLATAVGAIGGAALLAGGKPVLAAVLRLGAAALLYLAVEELLVEAHEQAETTLSAAMFFAGFLIIYILGSLGG